MTHQGITPSQSADAPRVRKPEQTDPTNEGLRLIERWNTALQELDRAKRNESQAQTVLNNAIVALGKWMLPHDAKEGEKFCVWFGDSLIEVSKDASADYRITTRLRGRSLSRL